MLQGHGDDAYKYPEGIRVNFSSNVWYGADLSGLRRNLASSLEYISSYPEPDAASLAVRLAEFHGIVPKSVCITNGATEAFYLIAQAFAGEESVIAVPSFSEYTDACCLYRHRITEVSKGFLLNERGNVPDKGLVWLCNPNNPDGQVLPCDTLKRLIETHPGLIFVIDQAYGDFTDKPLIGIKEGCGYPNAILVHSMTKKYGIAGLRLGYLTASPKLTAKIAGGRMPWSVNRLALAAGHYTLDHPADFTFGLADYLKETARLRAALDSIDGVETLPTDCHFFSAVLQHGTAAKLKDYLAETHGLLIRDASNFQGYGNRHFRIATQRPEENDLLVEATRQWMTERRKTGANKSGNIRNSIKQ